MSVKNYIVDKNGNEANVANLTMPSDRQFRNAWTLSGEVITEDMTKAKELFKEKIREVRKPLLEAEDVAYMKALEADDAAAKATSITNKTALRDATNSTAIANATTISELKAAWDTSTLGDNPYS